MLRQDAVLIAIDHFKSSDRLVSVEEVIEGAEKIFEYVSDGLKKPKDGPKMGEVSR